MMGFTHSRTQLVVGSKVIEGLANTRQENTTNQLNQEEQHSLTHSL